jgi:hypothetical protein
MFNAVIRQFLILNNRYSTSIYISHTCTVPNATGRPNNLISLTRYSPHGQNQVFTPRPEPGIHPTARMNHFGVVRHFWKNYIFGKSQNVKKYYSIFSHPHIGL